MLFLFRTFKVALLLFHLLHFIDTFLLFPGKALYFIEVNLSDFSFSKDFRLLRNRKLSIQGYTFRRQSSYFNHCLGMELYTWMQKTCFILIVPAFVVVRISAGAVPQRLTRGLASTSLPPTNSPSPSTSKITVS